jgi:hypothetical protein
MFCSFAYVKKIPQFVLIQLKYKLKGKNRFSGFTGLESDGFSVLILSKTAQAYGREKNSKEVRAQGDHKGINM